MGDTNSSTGFMIGLGSIAGCHHDACGECVETVRKVTSPLENLYMLLNLLALWV